MTGAAQGLRSYRGSETLVQGNSNPSAGEIAYPRRGVGLSPQGRPVCAERHLGRRHCRLGLPVIVWRSTPQPCFPLRRRRAPSRPATLDNHEIAFDGVRLGARRLRKGRSACGGVLRHGGTFARCGSRNLSTPPPPILLSPRCAIHPRMRLAWLGRNTSRRPARPPRGACRIAAVNRLWPRGRGTSPLAR